MNHWLPDALAAPHTQRELSESPSKLTADQWPVRVEMSWTTEGKPSFRFIMMSDDHEIDDDLRPSRLSLA